MAGLTCCHFGRSHICDKGLLTENRWFKVTRKELSPTKLICEPTVSLFTLKQIGACLAWLVSEATHPCWLAVIFGLLTAALLVFCTGMVSPQVKAMDVDQDVDSMDVNDPPLNSNSNDEGNAFRFQARSSMGSGRSITCECISRSMLQEWCKSFAILHSGNMKTMRERLAKFSGDSDAWDSSSQAKKIVESHPYVPLAAQKLAAEKALAKRMAGGNLALQENLKLTNAHIEELNHCLSHMSTGMASDCISISLTATPPSAPPLPSEHVTAPNEQPHPATSAAQISTSVATPSSALTRTIILGDRTELTFTEADVGSPSLTGFADDIAGLNRMWDDTTPNWGGTLVLEIKGHPIPIVYWKDIYMNSNCGSPWKLRQWHSMKSKWFNWKVIMHCYHQGIHTQFWDEFSHNGEQLCITKIIQQLSELRKDEDQATAECARADHPSHKSCVEANDILTPGTDNHHIETSGFRKGMGQSQYQEDCYKRAVLYSAPPIPAGIQSFHWNPLNSSKVM
ncbi:uncharacterized protein LACBIDRAFT_333229 [Laccaria bicolor S238N-H82]|uniref:Predicted protein n=1 Tax=Laccaria bicolor (strain S238N-H82 / ATCC MYA-4686) TaxID=486041 RepID=B0DVB7_LACBS|nr:uncharacterized protein LACBIDRAFT_333229 [Laccaria bicolor S238N-H82]EDR01548.1 predicted protein [Laccaria bicolor S238N-H82]|eukprot:XP_001887900.1 predicted protein [Laccaria bicolor S238N-H82]